MNEAKQVQTYDTWHTYSRKYGCGWGLKINPHGNGKWVSREYFDQARSKLESERALRKDAEKKLADYENSFKHMESIINATETRLHELQDAIVTLHKFNPTLTPLDEKSRHLIFEAIEESPKRREGK